MTDQSGTVFEQSTADTTNQLKTDSMKTRTLYTVSTIWDYSAVFPKVDAFTSEKAARELARFNHADGAKAVRLEKHVKNGYTTISKHTIFELTND